MNDKVFVLEDDANDGKMLRVIDDSDDSDDCSDDESDNNSVIDKSVCNKVIEGFDSNQCTDTGKIPIFSKLFTVSVQLY